MHDIQNEADPRGIAIDEVGISGLRYPVTFDDGHTCQHGIADISVTVGLQADRRGTHMSRMIALVHEEVATLAPQDLPIALKRGLALLEAPSLAVTLSLPIATTVTAPASKRQSWQTHDVTITGCITPDTCTVATTVTTDVTSLCPCSKAISDYGAHNQRSEVTLTVTGTADAPYPWRSMKSSACCAASAPPLSSPHQAARRTRRHHAGLRPSRLRRRHHPRHKPCMSRKGAETCDPG